jgi:hypothetical protein
VPKKVEEKKARSSLAAFAIMVAMRPLLWALQTLLGRPRDSILAILVASSVGAIIVNSLFLQHGRHPAPIFTYVSENPVPTSPAVFVPSAAVAVPSAQAADAHPPSAPHRTSAELSTGTLPVAALPRQRPPEAPPRIQQVSARTVPAHKDTIADILSPPQQLSAVQRALSEFGYGQIQPNGKMGPETKAAIERFERERNLTVTGRLSSRLVQELSAVTGRQL